MQALFYVMFIQGVIQSCLCLVAMLPVAILHRTNYSFVLTGGNMPEPLDRRITISRGMIAVVTVFSVPCTLVILTSVLALYIGAAGLFLDVEEEQARRLFRVSTCNAAASFATMVTAVYLGSLASLRTEVLQGKTVLALYLFVTAWFAVQCDMAIEISKRLDARVLHEQDFQIGEERIQIVVAFIMFVASVAQMVISPIAPGTPGTGLAWDAEEKIVTLVLLFCGGLCVLGGFFASFSSIYLFISNDKLSDCLCSEPCLLARISTAWSVLAAPSVVTAAGMQRIGIGLFHTIFWSNVVTLVSGGPVSAIRNAVKFHHNGLHMLDDKVPHAAFEQPLMTTVVVGTCSGAASYLYFSQYKY